MGLDPYTFGRVCKPEQIKIEGTGPAQRAYVTIRREEWVREGLEAYLALRLDTNMSQNDSEFHRRALAVMMRRIEGLASDYADRRLSRMPEGSRWSPVPAVVRPAHARLAEGGSPGRRSATRAAALYSVGWDGRRKRSYRAPQ